MRLPFLAVFCLVALWLAARASVHPLGLGYLDYPVTAQDEAVYSHAALRMAESGDWLTPVFLERFFLYKPPLLYWLAALSAKAFGASPLALRLPSILAAACAAGLVFVWVRERTCLPRAALATLLLLLSPLFGELGRRNMTDAIVMAAIVAAAWLLGRDERYLAVCIAAGILAKSVAGLIPIFIAGLYWLIAKERPPLRRLALAAALGLLAAAPWFFYQWEVHRRWFEAEFIGVELLAYGASAPPQTSGETALWFYAKRLWMYAAGLCLAFPLALPKLPWREPLAAALAVMATMILAYQYRNATYLLPLLPLMAIAAGLHAPVWALSLALLGGWWMTPAPPPPHPGLPLVQLAGQARSGDLIVVGLADDFSISTRRLANLRYAIQGAARPAGAFALDFRAMGIVLPVAEFNDLAAARARYAPKLREWGLPDDRALGTVIGWETVADLAELVRANPARDFLFPPGLAPPADASHRVAPGRGGVTLLLAN